MRKQLIFILIIVNSIKSWGLSGIDARFKFKKINSLMVQTSKVKSSSVRFYQKILSQTLSTSCDFYPSDSRKAQLDFKRCSPAYSILSAMERFYKEPDAGVLGYEIIQIKKKNYFYDLSFNCDFY